MVSIGGAEDHFSRHLVPGATCRRSARTRGCRATSIGPSGHDAFSLVCSGPMKNDDEGGYQLALWLFTIAIPIIGAIGAYLASQMPA